MDRTICDRCPWAKEGKAHGGWYYLACYHEPYQGAWVKQIDCPKEKEKENTMKIISSQHFIDWEIVESKREELTEAKAEKVTIPCSYVGRIDGVEYAMQNDKHHTLAAARELGLEVVYDVQEDSEGLTGEDLLAARYNDGDWYDVETSDPAYGVFNLIW